MGAEAGVMNAVIGRIFAITLRDGLIRRNVLIGIGGLLWAILALRAHPFVPGAEPLFSSALEHAALALFAANILRVVLLAALSFWAAYTVAARLMNDIFEMKNVSTSKRFIRQAAFASAYDFIEIKEGEVNPDHKRLPLYLIGGPGLVRVNLDSVAMFERINGQPHPIPPTTVGSAGVWSGRMGGIRHFLADRVPGLDFLKRVPPDGFALIEGFERLRSAIDLRDQTTSRDVADRTRDGIRLTARDVRAMYSVLRGDQPSTLENPYPFEPAAIDRLVYANTAPDMTIMVSVVLNLRLGDFIADHTLNEILAILTEAEVEKLRKEDTDLAGFFARQANGSTPPIPLNVVLGDFKPSTGEPRRRAADLFDIHKEFQEPARQRGIEFQWIDVGTWDVAHKNITEAQVKAWQATRDNMMGGLRIVVDDLRNKARQAELLRLIQDVPLAIFEEKSKAERSQLIQDVPPGAFIDRGIDTDSRIIIWHIVNAYCMKLRSALETYPQTFPLTEEEERLIAVIKYLDDILYRRRWLSGP
jgi:hypothetical protein